MVLKSKLGFLRKTLLPVSEYICASVPLKLHIYQKFRAATSSSASYLDNLLVLVTG